MISYTCAIKHLGLSLFYEISIQISCLCEERDVPEFYATVVFPFERYGEFQKEKKVVFEFKANRFVSVSRYAGTTSATMAISIWPS